MYGFRDCHCFICALFGHRKRRAERFCQRYGQVFTRIGIGHGVESLWVNFSQFDWLVNLAIAATGFGSILVLPIIWIQVISHRRRRGDAKTRRRYATVLGWILSMPGGMGTGTSKQLVHRNATLW